MARRLRAKVDGFAGCSNALLGCVKLAHGQDVSRAHRAKLMQFKCNHRLRATRGRDEFDLNRIARLDLHDCAHVTAL
jgi:hypothetical protein